MINKQDANCLILFTAFACNAKCIEIAFPFLAVLLDRGTKAFSVVLLTTAICARDP